MIDIWYKWPADATAAEKQEPGGIYACHGSCEIGRELLVDEFTVLKKFLDEHFATNDKRSEKEKFYWDVKEKQDPKDQSNKKYQALLNIKHVDVQIRGEWRPDQAASCAFEAGICRCPEWSELVAQSSCRAGPEGRGFGRDQEALRGIEQSPARRR